MELRSTRNAVQIEKEYLENVQKICKQILQCRDSKNRLELTNFFEAVDRVLHARYFDFTQYNSENFREALKIVRDQFGLDYSMANLIKDHEESFASFPSKTIGSVSPSIGSRATR